MKERTIINIDKVTGDRFNKMKADRKIKESEALLNQLMDLYDHQKPEEIPIIPDDSDEDPHFPGVHSMPPAEELDDTLSQIEKELDRLRKMRI